MSDLHTLPLRGHDMPSKPQVRARVYGYLSITGRTSWYWSYQAPNRGGKLASSVIHGPFGSWGEAYNSAHRMVSLL